MNRILLHMRALPNGGLTPRQLELRRGVSAEMAMGVLLNNLLTGGSYRMKWRPLNQVNLAFSRLVVAVDFTDAFCRVLPAKIEHAFRKRQIPHYLCYWVRAYLTNRVQRVFVGGKFSAPFACPVGCPQGSIIGPLLWNLAMDDLLDTLDEFRTDAQAVVFDEAGMKATAHPPNQAPPLPRTHN